MLAVRAQWIRAATVPPLGGITTETMRPTSNQQKQAQAQARQRHRAQNNMASCEDGARGAIQQFQQFPAVPECSTPPPTAQRAPRRSQRAPRCLPPRPPRRLVLGPPLHNPDLARQRNELRCLEPRTAPCGGATPLRLRNHAVSGVVPRRQQLLCLCPALCLRARADRPSINLRLYSPSLAHSCSVTDRLATSLALYLLSVQLVHPSTR
jgi:hypothetical protein